MNFLNISCKKATLLVSKKEENKLSWLEGIKLRAHLTICSICRRFEIQSKWIGHHAHHAHIDTILSPESKQKMQNVLKDQ